LDEMRAWMEQHHQMLDERLDRLGELLHATKGTPE
jgi:hypothetical protein